MKMFILMQRQITKKLIGLIFAILQVTVAMFILNVSVGKINYFNYTKNIIEINDPENLYYLSINDVSDNFFREQEEMIQRVRKRLSDINDVLGVKYVFFDQKLPGYIRHSDGLKGYDVIAYTQNGFKYRPILSSGKWIEDVETEKGVYPTVISNSLAKQYKIGDRLKVEIFGSSYELEVCGILKEPNLVMRLTSGGTHLVWNNFFKEHEEVLLTCSIDDKKILKADSESGDSSEIDNMLLAHPPGGVFVKLDSGLSYEQKDATLNNLTNYGSLLSFTDIDELHQQIVDDKTKSYAVNYLLLIIMGLMGVVGVSILSSIRELSEYSIWYLCGSKWSNIYILNFLRVFVILLVSVLLNIIVLFTPYAQENLLYNSILTMKECITTGGILLAILLISNGVVFYTVKTNSPVDILRRFYKE